MVMLPSLWLPILAAAVLVFIASSILHMFAGHHKSDYRALPDEEAARRTLHGLAPGEYVIPYAGGMAAMKEEAFVRKMAEGPVATITVRESGDAGLGKQLTLWFLYLLVVSLLAAYVAGRALGTGAPSLEVFRFAGTSAFLAYAVGVWSHSIWFGRPWSTAVKDTVDGLIYAGLTAGVFVWLWP